MFGISEIIKLLYKINDNQSIIISKMFAIEKLLQGQSKPSHVEIILGTPTKK